MDDSSATNSKRASCFNRFPEVGTSVGLVKYGDMSAVLEFRRACLGERDGDEEIDADEAEIDGVDGSADARDRDDEADMVDAAKAFKYSECVFSRTFGLKPCEWFVRADRFAVGCTAKRSPPIDWMESWCEGIADRAWRRASLWGGSEIGGWDRVAGSVSIFLAESDREAMRRAK